MFFTPPVPGLDPRSWAEESVIRLRLPVRPIGSPVEVRPGVVEWPQLDVEFGGLRCRMRGADLAGMWALVLLFASTDFIQLISADADDTGTSGDAGEAVGEVRLVEAFRDACQILQPEVAAIVKNRPPDLWELLEELAQEALTVDTPALVRRRLGLLYLSGSFASDLDTFLPPGERDEIPVEDGRLIFAGTGENRWWG